jgi:hypothetical protein
MKSENRKGACPEYDDKKNKGKIFMATLNAGHPAPILK